MQKYFLHIFIGVGLVIVASVVVSAYQFKNTEWFWFMPQSTDQGSVHAPGNVVGDELPAPTSSEANDATENSGTHTKPPVVGGKLKADVFTGKLEVVDTGCFADGECFVIVGGKHVTVIMGRSQEVVGKVEGVEGFGDLEKYIGKDVEVYAQVNPDNTYTLYGSEGFYVKLLDNKGTPAPTKPVAGAGCVIGGCSGQLCVDASKGDVVSTCEWTEAYACYQTATCEKQTTGQCGWTETEKLNQCLADAKMGEVVQVQ